MSDIRIKMAKDLRDMSDMVGDLHWMAAKAIEDLTKKEGEIAKRDARIVELEDLVLSLQCKAIESDDLHAELAAIKAQEPVAYISGCYRDVIGGKSDRTPLGAELAFVNMGWIGQIPLYAAPVSEAKARGVIDFVFSGELPNATFVEVEDGNGNSINVGEWFKRDDGYLVLRLNAAPVQQDQAFCEYCGGNDEEPQDHCMDCTRPVQQVSVPDDEAVMAKARELFGWAYGLGGFSDAVRDLVAFAHPAAPAADAWIPVSERLPAVESRLDQECRAGTLSIAPLNVSAAVLVFDGEKVRSTRLEWFDGCLPLPYCITHWMPLPAAPAANSAKGVV